MTKPSQALRKINLQLFASDPEETPSEGTEEAVQDWVDDDGSEWADEQQQEDEENEEQQEDEKDEGQQEEYDEILYNKEPVKIPKSERQTYLQKGYNYDKVQTKLTDYEQKIKALEEQAGVPIDQLAQKLEEEKAKKQEQELLKQAENYAYDHGVSEEVAREILLQKAELQRIKQQENLRQQEQTLAQKREQQRLLNQEMKQELKDKPFFKDLEPEIDEAVKATPDLTVETAYYYLRGKNMDKLLASEKKNVEKRTLANIQDRAKRGLASSSDGSPSDVKYDVDSEMCEAFGTDPREIAKIKKELMKKRR